MAIPYQLPRHWMRYDRYAIFDQLVEAKSAVKALKATPYQKDWVEELQKIQLKMEVAGTSRIEGAEFTEQELDEALSSDESSELATRSQRQARAAAGTYRWVSAIPDGRPVDEALICEIHRRMVTGCDDDHCSPGRLRQPDNDVTFGVQRHRGCAGGEQCRLAFSNLTRAIGGDYQSHDPLIQAIAVHYHFAAMHPFGDGNGRTARALEALLLQRAGLRDTAFIAMSNYYYEEKDRYLASLAEVHKQGHDLTAFLNFALRGVAIQCGRLLHEIKLGVQKSIFRNTMNDLFDRLRSPRKRVLARRQQEILRLLLDAGTMHLSAIERRTEANYRDLRKPLPALVRDLSWLAALGAVTLDFTDQKDHGFLARINLNWPAEIQQTEFLDRVKKMRKTKT